jgi:ParB-like chromosome segregation protein Spo0J
LYYELEGPVFEGLVESMEREGLREPIWVTPDGIIVDGHQRRLAGERLGWTEIKVWVREDLAGDQDAIDLAHITVNRDRRQLDPLGETRLERREMEIERKRGPGGLTESDEKELPARVVKRIGGEIRNARRYVNVSRTPMAVQKAFSAGKLALVRAEKVSRLSDRAQKQVAEEIEAGGDPTAVVEAHLQEGAPRVNPATAFGRIMSAVERNLDFVEGHADEIGHTAGRIYKTLDLIRRLESFAGDVRVRLEERARRLAEPMHGFSVDPGGWVGNDGTDVDAA